MSSSPCVLTASCPHPLTPSLLTSPLAHPLVHSPLPGLELFAVISIVLLYSRKQVRYVWLPFFVCFNVPIPFSFILLSLCAMMQTQPPEILSFILSYLPIPTLLECRTVTSAWRLLLDHHAAPWGLLPLSLPSMIRKRKSNKTNHDHVFMIPSLGEIFARIKTMSEDKFFEEMHRLCGTTFEDVDPTTVTITEGYDAKTVNTISFTRCWHW